MVWKYPSTSVLIVALFTVAKIWKQPKCPLTEEWIKQMSTHTKKYYSVIKKKWSLAICDNRMNPEGLMVKWNMSDTDKCHMISLPCGIWNQKSKKNPELIETENRLVVARCWGGRSNGMGKIGEGSQKVWTPSYKIYSSWGCDIQNDDYIY